MQKSVRISEDTPETFQTRRSKTVPGTNFVIEEPLPPAPQEVYTYETAYDFLNYYYGHFLDKIGEKRNITNFSIKVMPELAEKMVGYPVLKRHTKRVPEKQKDIRKVIRSLGESEMSQDDFLEWVLVTGGKRGGKR